MARKLRVQYPGAIYHVMNRGERCEAIFEDDADREKFIETLGEACGKIGWQVQAYCLMPNHFHLVVETPQANLSAGMKWFLGDPEKIAIARRLREETTMTLAWVANRLNMGTKTHLAHLLYWQGRNK